MALSEKSAGDSAHASSSAASTGTTAPHAGSRSSANAGTVAGLKAFVDFMAVLEQDLDRFDLIVLDRNLAQVGREATDPSKAKKVATAQQFIVQALDCLRFAARHSDWRENCAKQLKLAEQSLTGREAEMRRLKDALATKKAARRTDHA